MKKRAFEVLVESFRLAGLGVLCLLVGCGQRSDVADLKAFTDNAFKDHIPEVEPLPAIQPQAIFIYTASSLTDPFNIDNLKEKVEDLPLEQEREGPDRTRRKEPLEQFPIDALKLVGVLNQNGETWAVIRAPDQSVHRVTVGNYMGVNYGEIIAVEENTVAASELVKNPVGRWERKEASLILVE